MGPGSPFLLPGRPCPNKAALCGSQRAFHDRPPSLEGPAAAPPPGTPGPLTEGPGCGGVRGLRLSQAPGGPPPLPPSPCLPDAGPGGGNSGFGGSQACGADPGDGKRQATRTGGRPLMEGPLGVHGPLHPGLPPAEASISDGPPSDHLPRRGQCPREGPLFSSSPRRPVGGQTPGWLGSRVPSSRAPRAPPPAPVFQAPHPACSPAAGAVTHRPPTH